MFRIIRAVFLSTVWWWTALAVLMVGYAKCARSAPATTSRVHPAEKQIRAVLDRNFEAYNKEDVPGMLNTLSPTLPRRDEFAREATDNFRDNDAYISVHDFELLEVRGQFAVARVVQGTMVREGAPEPTEEQDFYREKSKLLPDAEKSEYIQAFKRENGKWRLWLIMDSPKPFTGNQDGVNVRSSCPNGNCGFPRVRVSAR